MQSKGWLVRHVEMIQHVLPFFLRTLTAKIMHVTKITKPLETAVLGKAWLWLLPFAAPPVLADPWLAPMPCHQIALLHPIPHVCIQGLTGDLVGFGV